MGAADRIDQSLDDLALDPVGEMARVGDIGKAAPAVGDLTVLDQGVPDVGEQRQVVAERCGQRFGGGAGGLFLRRKQAMQRRFERHGLAVDLKAQPRHGLVEQGAPRR